jgi:hypothetical protein
MSDQRAANQDWLVNRLIGIVTMVREGTWNDDDVAYEAAAIRDRIEPPLRSAGYAVATLPKPDYGPDGSGQYGWSAQIAPVSASDERVWMEDTDMEPHEAQELAAALLAAADYAERDQ